MQAARGDRDGDLPERPFLAEVNLPAALRTPEPRANAREGNCSTPDSHEFGFSEQASWFGSPEPSILRRRSHFGVAPGSTSKTGGLHGVELSPAGRALLRGATPKMKVHTVRRRQQRSDRLFVTGDPEDLRHILRDAHILNDARERAKRRADQSLRKVLCELRETMASGASAKPSSYRTTTATTTPSPVDLEQRHEARERILDLGDRFLHASVLEDDDQHHAKLVDIVEELLHLRTFENKFCTLVLFAISPYSRRALAIEALNDEDHAQAHESPRNLSEAYFAALDQIAEGVDLLLRARADDAGDELEAADRQRLLAQAQERLASILDSLGKAPAYGSLKALAVEALDAAIAQSASAQTPRSRQQLSKIPKRPKKPSPKEFDFTKVISRGSVGRVFLAIKRGTGDVYAVKVMDKAEVVRKNLAARIVAERNVMARADCPFVVKLFFSFETRTRLFLAMEFVQGGDILALLNTYGVIPEGAVRWYASEIVVALKYLHERLNVCHRDLKPDNILIGRDGHVKLTDFGLSHIGIVQGLDASVADVATPNQSDSSLSVTSSPARDFENKGVASAQTRHRLAASTPALLKSRVGAEASETRSPLVQPPSNVPPTPRDDAAASTRRRLMRSQVGTPDYMAPEILLGTGHGFACDWWSLGIIIYEMLFGMPPFNDETPQRIFHNILSGKLPPEEERAPATASEIAWDLIYGLLQTSAADRLGSQGAWELQQHPFFEGVSWASLESGDLPSTDEAVPFVPAVVSEMDTKYFESASPAAPSIPASPQTHSFSQHSPGQKGQPAGLLVEDETLDMLNSDDIEEDLGPETAEFGRKPPPLYFDDDEEEENGLEGDVPHVDDDDDDVNEDNRGDATCSKVREEDFHQHESRCKKVNESSEGGCRVNKMGGLGANNQRETVENHVKKLPEHESIFPEIDFSCSQLSNLQKLNMAAVENDGDDASDIDVDDSENEDKEQDEDDERSGNAEEFE
ncbi:Protein kinase, putative [Hondaea fermentalgiana]|uniref:non-specific serine/threonine protein kinase n=1 Tax=Hondaea fermentalgiana TaxID=2315210 RepID=A0A2R5GVY1_9STRA|nr:Protein kinase, putative [Hondaea fermentalgiana]|eukprot:GBG34489.1 Protein kinase, putative [Hondaea fermentalgiana]